MSNHKNKKLPPRSPFVSDDENDSTINVILEQETAEIPLKETVIEHRKTMFVEPEDNVIKLEQKPQEPQEPQETVVPQPKRRGGQRKQKMHPPPKLPPSKLPPPKLQTRR